MVRLFSTRRRCNAAAMCLAMVGCASPAPPPPSITGPAAAHSASAASVVAPPTTEHIDIDGGGDEERELVAQGEGRTVELPWGRGSASLAIGDRARSGDWQVQWTRRSGSVVTLRATHRGSAVGEWKTTVDRSPAHELASKDGLRHFEVTLTAMDAGTISLVGHEIERAVPAKLGQSVAPGLYVFPDGLRIRIEQLTACDFDTSVPCFGGTYRATAALGDQTASVDWSTKSTKVLRYTLTLSNMRIVVTK